MTLKEIADQYGFPFYFVAGSLQGVYEAIAIEIYDSQGYGLPQIIINEINPVGMYYIDMIVGSDTKPTFFQPLNDEYLFKEKFEKEING